MHFLLAVLHYCCIDKHLREVERSLLEPCTNESGYDDQLFNTLLQPSCVRPSQPESSLRRHHDTH